MHSCARINIANGHLLQLGPFEFVHLMLSSHMHVYEIKFKLYDDERYETISIKLRKSFWRQKSDSLIDHAHIFVSFYIHHFHLRRYLRQPQIRIFLPIAYIALRLSDSRISFFTYILIRAQKCEASPSFLFAINLIGFFHTDCQTLSKINGAVFCHESLLKC
jgi:hypothetical protein